jgi:N utilization substance protein B
MKSPKAGVRTAGARTSARTLARVAAVQALYQSEHAGESAETVIDQFVRFRFGAIPGPSGRNEDGLEEGRVPDAHVPLFGRIVRVAVEQQDTLDAMIAEAIPPTWPLARLDPVLRALLRAGAAELWMADGPPARVAINEYVDVAHGFLQPEAVQMVNAVMDRLARLLRGAEFAPPSGTA